MSALLDAWLVETQDENRKQQAKRKRLLEEFETAGDDEPWETRVKRIKRAECLFASELATFDELKRRLEKKEEELIELQRENEMNEAEIDRLEDRISDLRDKIDQLKGEHDECKRENMTLKLQNASLIERNDELEAELANERHAISRLRDQRRNL